MQDGLRSHNPSAGSIATYSCASNCCYAFYCILSFFTAIETHYDGKVAFVHACAACGDVGGLVINCIGEVLFSLRVVDGKTASSLWSQNHERKRRHKGDTLSLNFTYQPP